MILRGNPDEAVIDNSSGQGKIKISDFFSKIGPKADFPAKNQKIIILHARWERYGQTLQ
jgi:hypothetical protein